MKNEKLKIDERNSREGTAPGEGVVDEDRF